MNISPAHIKSILVTELCNGSEIAFRKIFDQYKIKVFHYCLKMVRNPVDAEELLHDVFLKVWQFRSRIDPAINFEIFLFTIARNHLLNFVRKKIPVTTVPPDQLIQHTHLFHEEDQLNYKEIYAQYRLVLQSLSPKSRQAFELSREYGLSNKEIARQMNVSVRTAETHVSNALSVLRGELKDTFILLMILLSQ